MMRISLHNRFILLHIEVNFRIEIIPLVFVNVNKIGHRYSPRNTHTHNHSSSSLLSRINQSILAFYSLLFNRNIYVRSLSLSLKLQQKRYTTNIRFVFVVCFLFPHCSRQTLHAHTELVYILRKKGDTRNNILFKIVVISYCFEKDH